MSRCTGGCCRRFTLPHPPEWFDREIAARERALADDAEEWARRLDGRKPLSLGPMQVDDQLQVRRYLRELRTIRDMVIPLGRPDRWLYDPTVKFSEIPNHEGLDPAPWYTCKHFDTGSGNCGIYDRRPDMCAGYPYGTTCKYTGCTSSEARKQLAPGDVCKS